MYIFPNFTKDSKQYYPWTLLLNLENLGCEAEVVTFLYICIALSFFCVSFLFSLFFLLTFSFLILFLSSILVGIFIAGSAYMGPIRLHLNLTQICKSNKCVIIYKTNQNTQFSLVYIFNRQKYKEHNYK